MTRARRSWDRGSRDDGITLVELIVVMALLPIVLGLSSVMLISAMRHQSTTQMRADAQTQNRAGLEFVTRLLRQATFPTNGSSTDSTIITEAGPTRIVFTSRLGGASTVHRYVIALDGNQLRWNTVGPTCPTVGVCSYTTPLPTRVLVSNVRNATSADCPGGTNGGAVFRYYALNPIDGSLSSTPLTQPVSGSAQLASIVVVGVDIWTKSQTSRDAPGTCEHINGYVDLRNAR